MNLVSWNGLVACEPLGKRSVDISVKEGIASISQRGGLVETRVVFWTDDRRFAPGQRVWLRGEFVKDLKSGQVNEIGERRFILVPLAQIVLQESLPGAEGR